jgi:hypothetical protein
MKRQSDADDGDKKNEEIPQKPELAVCTEEIGL